MKIYLNTKTLDGLIDDLDRTEEMAEADIAVLGSKPIDINQFPSLKAILRLGVGKDNLPFEEAKKRDITIRMPSERTINCIYEETANTTVGLILTMLYNKVGDIDSWTKFSRSMLNNKTLLVIGAGHIGKKVIEKMKPLLKVAVFDALNNNISELDDMLKEADVISLHIPMCEENKGFIDKQRIDLMKKNAVLVNTARGPLVDEDALYNAIEAEKMRAAFDVFWKEPYEGKLKNLPRDKFLMTPHISSNTTDFLNGCVNDLRQLIRDIEAV